MEYGPKSKWNPNEIHISDGVWRRYIIIITYNDIRHTLCLNYRKLHINLWEDEDKTSNPWNIKDIEPTIWGWNDNSGSIW